MRVQLLEPISYEQVQGGLETLPRATARRRAQLRAHSGSLALSKLGVAADRGRTHASRNKLGMDVQLAKTLATRADAVRHAGRQRVSDQKVATTSLCCRFAARSRQQYTAVFSSMLREPYVQNRLFCRLGRRAPQGANCTGQIVGREAAAALTTLMNSRLACLGTLAVLMRCAAQVVGIQDFWRS